MPADCAVQLHVAAYHAAPGYRGDTPGVGALCDAGGDLRVAAGTYLNSQRKQSAYVGWAWQPIALGVARVGVYGGMVSGYRIPLLPVAGAVVSVPLGRVTAHMLIIPEVRDITPTTAAVSFSFKF
jgi:hypothetical protein